MADLPLITIVTPSLNQGRFIERTIQSVLGQEYPRLEYLVVDGGSTDETVSVLKKYEGRLRWVSERDGGQAAAINKGFSGARGDILGWLNSDDVYAPGALKHVVDCFQEFPESDLVYGRARHINFKGDVIAPYPTEPFFEKRLAEICFICQPATFFKARVFRDVGPLNEGLQYCMDYDYWIRSARRFHIHYDQNILADSRLHADAKTLSHRGRMHREIVETVKRYYGRVPLGWILGWACFDLADKLRMPFPAAYGRTWFWDGLRFHGWGLKTFLFMSFFPAFTAWRYFSVNRRFPGQGEWAQLIKKIGHWMKIWKTSPVGD